MKVTAEVDIDLVIVEEWLDLVGVTQKIDLEHAINSRAGKFSDAQLLAIRARITAARQEIEELKRELSEAKA